MSSAKERTIMARLPQAGGDDGNWGTILNDYLLQSHDEQGALKQNTVSAGQLQTNSVTNDAVADGTITESQLDTALAAKVNGNVTLTGSQTIAGVKTYSSSPIVPTPATNAQVANKQYVDASIVSAGHSGRELAYADINSQYRIEAADNSWHNIPGLTITTATTDRPAYVTAHLGIIVVETTEYCNVLVSILNETDTVDLFHQEIQVLPSPSGFGVASVPPIIVRIPAGTASKTYDIRVQSFDGKAINVAPSWSTNKPSLFAIEA